MKITQIKRLKVFLDDYGRTQFVGGSPSPHVRSTLSTTKPFLNKAFGIDSLKQ